MALLAFIQRLLKHNASGAVMTYTLTIATTADEAQVVRLTADPEAVPSGGASSITAHGVNMPDNVTVLGIFANAGDPGVVAGTSPVQAAGDGTLRIADLTFPSQPADTVYYVKASVDGGTSWEDANVRVTVYGTPTVTSIAAANRSLSWSGDDVGVVASGTNLSGGVTVGAFTDGASVPSVAGITYGDANRQETSLAIPPNRTSGVKSYVLKVSLDGGATWQASPTDSLTVAAMPMVSSVTANPAKLPQSGGTSVVTVKGTNLLNAALLTVDIFSDGEYTNEYEELTVNSDTEATATVTFPANSGSSGRAYALKIWRIEDEEYYDEEASVVVGDAKVDDPPNNPDPGSPGGGCGVGTGGAALAVLALFAITAKRRENR